ncbi:MAG: type II toxin-antitoxin system VapC family toxin [Caldilineales bacterium]
MGMLDFVVDASVFVAGIRPSEPSYKEARTALETLSRRRANLYVPAIVLAEVAAAIGRGSGSAEQAAKDVDLIGRLTGLQLVSVDHALANLAAVIAAHQRIRGCDAVYVALAQDRNGVLITLDNEQRQRSPSSVLVWTPEELLKNWYSN